MAVRFDVRLRGGQPDGDVLRFAPGDEITGSAEIVSDTDLFCNHLYLRLQWHTEGRGDCDEGTVEQLDIVQGTLSAGVPVTQEFSFRLPDLPWSYAGQYV